MKACTGLLLLLLPCSLLAQSKLIEVPLQPINTYLPKSTNQVGTAQSVDLTGFRGIPGDLTEKVLRFHNTIRGQTAYEAFQSGQLSGDEWVKTKRGLGADSTLLSPKPIHQRINTLVGTDKLGRRVLIVDVNNNQDFSDDRVLYYPMTLPAMERHPDGRYVNASMRAVYDTLPAVQVHIQAFDGTQIVDRMAWVQPNPYNDGTIYKDPEANRFHLTLLDYEHRTGSATVLGEPLKFIVTNGLAGLPYNTRSATVKIAQVQLSTDKTVTVHTSEYTPSQSFFLNNRRIQIVGVSANGDKLYLADRGAAGNSISKPAEK